MSGGLLGRARGAIERARGRDSRGWRHVAVGAAVVGIVAAGWQVGHLPRTEAEPVVAQAVLAGTTLHARSICDGGATEPFTPSRIAVQDVVRRAPVIALARDADNVPGVPPLSEAGKHEFAWDRPPGILPGSAQGNVLLNAHTWPWTSAPALGNLMLKRLHVGDRIVLFGTTEAGAEAHLCYEVTKQVSIRAEQRYPEYWVTDGPPQIAIMVCSGVRRGPGDWAERTVWFASPVPGDPAAEATGSPSADPATTPS